MSKEKRGPLRKGLKTSMELENEAVIEALVSSFSNVGDRSQVVVG